MKTSPAAEAQSSVQSEEDCGVWLDTVKLKRKVQKKRSARPISKLLNPFTNGAGYNVAVALNFTQTKMEMPKTKQSSISNFFTCQRRVLNKMSTSGRQNEGSQEACFSTTGNTESESNNEPLWSDLDYSQERSTQLDEPHAAMWQKMKDCDCHFSSPNIHNDYEEESPTNLSQFINESNLTSNNCDIEQESSHTLHCNHESYFLSSLPSQSEFNAFGDFSNAGGRTSTQKTLNGHSSTNDEENQMFSRQTKQKTLKKHILLENSYQDEDPNLPMKWTKLQNSPIKNQSGQFHDEEESISMLFTQDSQGFRVIAHRGPQSPLKDLSNKTIPSAGVEENEQHMFTQDSQGNMVIKHVL